MTVQNFLCLKNGNDRRIRKGNVAGIFSFLGQTVLKSKLSTFQVHGMLLKHKKKISEQAITSF